MRFFISQKIFRIGTLTINLPISGNNDGEVLLIYKSETT